MGPSGRPAEPRHPDYALHGGAAEGFHARDPELLLAGPAGTGKTLALLLRVYWTCQRHPGARCLIVRKTRTSLTESVLVTWERDVLGPGHPALGPRPVLRRARQAYQFPNGSWVATAGMDRPDKVLSSEWDLVYAPEATELTLTDWETLLGRLRAGVVADKQLVADCNPTTPAHWLYRRCTEAGLCRLIRTDHRDNPRYYDRAGGRWTAEGEAYLARLGRLTGPRRARFLDGTWARAEGLVWDGWDPAVHLVAPFLPPRDWPRYLAIDFGFTAPFVAQFWALDPAGRLYLYREIYRPQALVSDHAERIRELLAGEAVRPRAVVCDPADAEGRATLERHLRVRTTGATKDTVRAGIQEVAERLAPAADGKPTLLVCRDALAHPPDPGLAAAGRPTCTAEEVGGWVWDPAATAGERPVDRDNHGCDAMRYLAKHLAAGRAGGPGRVATGSRAESVAGDVMGRQF